MLIEKLRHQLAGHRSHRFGTSSETIEQLQLALEASEVAVAKMTAKLRLPDEEEKDKPKRRPIPDHIPRQEIELTTGDEDCAHCGGTLRRLGEDVTEELEYVPGARPLFLNQWRTRSRHRKPDRPSPHGLFRLRSLHPGCFAIATDRARSPRPWPAGPCPGLQIRQPSAALSPEPDLRARGARPRPFDTGRLGR
ncbi:IS66 family transposase zinc-finger binding domain-containing protein, partial [Ponticoccus sp. SC6-31]|nr:IS66 family transposase zinc-finger binding domain-containing protein [Ponticoccus sp. SC6-31]